MESKPRKKSENIPAPLADTGDSVSRHLGQRVRKLRNERGWSLEVLASVAGVSRSMLSEIEREQANPTLAVIYRLARVFDMTLDELVELPGVTSSISVIHANDRAYHYRSDDDCKLRTLSPLNLEKDVEFYELELRPGGTLQSAAHFEGTREFLTVQEGHIQVESSSETESLEKGDSASYRADVPHSIKNIGAEDARVFLVVIYK